ncbi:hypothetical protein T05_9869 [Trichinella murrelli]|uniref:Uncharacterized protein n=1 Tax=Trichinella murrelli TaxID=144512 RepID=A0A0V0T4L4_9BILA|nr:hypothetical protein T05_9869 [Trichinella murrelli]
MLTVCKNRTGSVRSRCSSTICQTFARRENESGLYDVGSSSPTEYRVVQKTVVYGRMQADRPTTNIRSFYSATNNQRNALRRQQRTESQYRTGRNNSTRNRWLLQRQARIGGPGSGSFGPPMSSSLTAAPLISRWSFGVPPPHGVSLTPPGYCPRPTRDFRPPAPGQVTPTKSVLFRSEHCVSLLARPDVQQRIKNTNTQINTVQVYHILKAARTLRITRAQFKEGLDKADLDYQPLIIVVEFVDETSVSV